MNIPTVIRCAGLGLCLFLAACPLESKKPEFTTLQYADGSEVRGIASGVNSKRFQVVNDLDEFEALWADHVEVFFTAPPVPTVDFAGHSVIAVFAGDVQTGGHEIEVATIDERGDVTEIVVVHEGPHPSCATTLAQTQPHHMVSARLNPSKPLRFVEFVVIGDPC